MKVIIFLHLMLITCYCNKPNISDQLHNKFSQLACGMHYGQKDSTSCYFLPYNCTTRLKYVSDWENPTLRPYCKEVDYIIFKFEFENDSIPVVQIRGKNVDWMWANISNCNGLKIHGLQEDTSYQVRLWEISQKNEIYGPAESNWITTSSSNELLLPISNVTHQLTFGEFKYVSDVIRWYPAEDLPCHYSIYVHDDTNGAFHREAKRDLLENLYELEVDKLQFGHSYAVYLVATSEDQKRESAQFESIINIPSCLERYYNLSVCVPPCPENLTVTDKALLRFNDTIPPRNLTISWSEPYLTPDRYHVWITNKDDDFEESIEYKIQVPGDKTSVTFTNFTFKKYVVFLRAESSAGDSETVVSAILTPTLIKPSLPSTSWPYGKLILTLVGSMCIILSFIIIAFLLYHQNAKRKRTKKRIQYFQELDQKAPPCSSTLIPDIENVFVDEWEINLGDLTLQSILGEGAFGIVRKGILMKNEKSKCEVAVKTVKDNPTPEEIRQFYQEIAIMKTVGLHPHLVSLIGCCSRNVNCSPLLVVEYCSKGSLQIYLRNVWGKITNQCMDLTYAELFEDSSPSVKHFVNKLYDLSDDLNNEFFLHPTDLLSFARQTAIGMEYLSSLRILHRDLATRNILICENRTIKIADFGLSRDVYNDNVYCKTGNSKLPIRWMALESLTHQCYTIQSDVWSFGIVVWEIITLGGNPYPGVTTQDLLERLKSGYRMEKPENCDDELYALMVSCWKEAPQERPTFKKLRKELDVLLENECKYVQIPSF